MIYVDHKITLDVHNVAAPVFVRLKKKDSARRILVYLTEKSQPYQITEDCYAVFTAKKPDGKVIFNDCTIDGNTIIYKITDQTTAAVGQFDAEIKLYGGDGKLITSPFFTIVVADTVYDEGEEIESTDEYNALAALIERVQSLETTSALICKAALPMVVLEGMTVQILLENFNRTPKIGEVFNAICGKRYTILEVVGVTDYTCAAKALASVEMGGGGGIAVETDPTVPAWAKQPKKPTYTASEVGARPDTWTPTAKEVGALPNSYTPPNQTAEQVGADPKGTAAGAVSDHNTNTASHEDIRLLIEGLATRLNALANSTDTDLDQMAELVAYIKNNKSLIDGITTSKVSVADIVNNLTTNVANKPLSAAQGVALKALIDAITVPTKLSQLTNDKGYITGYTETDPTVPAWAKNATKPSYSKSEVGLGNVDNVKQYSASNPPPYPVTSVNGKTGAVSLDAAAVGARPSTWMPSASDVGALPASTTIPTKVSQLTNDKGYLTEHQDISGKLDASALPTAIDTALAQAKASGEFDGEDGQRGTGLLSVTTAPSSYTTAVGGITPKYRMALSTIKTQAGVTEVLLGDTVRYSYYHYPIDYMDASYAYFTERVSIRGATGAAGKTAYAYAQDGGYAGTETEFAEKLANEYNMNPLYGKKVSFLGDSICAGSSESTSYLGGYGKIIADRNGMVYENVAQAGSTITAETYASSGVAKGWICRMVANMSADADYAIVEGGYNDAWHWLDHGSFEIGKITDGYNATLDDTTYYGAFESMLKQLVTKFQGKKIGYIAVPKLMSYYDSNRNAPNFYHIALECCAKWGVPVCDLNTIIPPFEYLKTLGTTYMADNAHPTYEGYLKYYCDPIEAWMKTLTTGASVSVGGGSVDTSDFVSKNDVQIKKAQLTLEDGSTVLIDVVVASAGTTINKYLNLIPTSIDADGSIYNGVGYKPDTRLSSSGVTKAGGGTITTGFIPAVGGDVIHLGGAKPWYTSAKNDNYLCAYDSNFNYIGGTYNTGANYYTADIVTTVELGDVCKLTLASGLNIAYIRASWPSDTDDAANTIGAQLIITVNQEIT